MVDNGANWHPMQGFLHALNGKRQGSYLYHDYRGFYYHFSYSYGNVAVFKCKNYYSGCRGRARFCGMFSVTQGHTCERDYEFKVVHQLKQNIFARCREFPFLSFRDIVHLESSRFPRRIRSRVNSNFLRGSMRRARLENYPALPYTLRELGELLGDPQYSFLTQLQDDDDNIFAASFDDAEGSHHIIFLSQEMSRVLQQVRFLFGDGHFASRPATPPSSQIFNLVTVIDNHTVWLGCVLMESRTEVAYNSVFEMLKHLAPDLNPEFIFSDFERAQQNAWLTAFPNARIFGCLWHFCRALIKKASKLGMMRWIRGSRRIRRLLRMCCALPLLPQNLLLDGLYEVSVECLRHGHFIADLFEPFIDYLYSKWITNPGRAHLISVFGSIYRTNNACESVNRWMKHDMGTLHPNVYAFLGTLLRMNCSSSTTLDSLNAGIQPARQRKTSAMTNDLRIQSLSRQLLQRPLGLRHAIRNLLFYGSNTIRRAFNDLIAHPGDELEQQAQ